MSVARIGVVGDRVLDPIHPSQQKAIVPSSNKRQVGQQGDTVNLFSVHWSEGEYGRQGPYLEFPQ